MALNARHIISSTDLSPAETLDLLRLASKLKTSDQPQPLKGKTVALLFEKPSLRTKVSFQVATTQLGGASLFLGPDEVGLGRREPVADVARVLSRMVDAVVVRTFAQKTLEEMARYSSVPVINALSDAEHPCQALADLLTLFERFGFDTEGLSVTYLGDGNNVAASLALTAAAVGVSFRIASPPGYELPKDVSSQVKVRASASGASFQELHDPREAVEGASAVYTDVWTSMGQETESQERLKVFQGYQVTTTLLDAADPSCVFLHPLPAHPGEEIEAGLLDDPRSFVFEQAENRLHAQKALLAELFEGS